MADQPFDPHADRVPQDGFTLAAQEALALVAGSGLAQFFDCIPATVWMTDTDLKLTLRKGRSCAIWTLRQRRCSAGRFRKSSSMAARITRSFTDI
jgi:hypothetical protein